MFKGASTRLRVGGLTVLYVVALTISALHPLKARADATISYAGSTVNGMTEDVIALTGITVGGSDPTIPVTLSIDDGILSMATTTGLTFSGDTTGSSISFSGSASDITTALATLQYRSITQGSKTLTATILADGAVYYPGNGHIYEVVDYGVSHSWNTANTEAQARTFNGASGYLATVTTQAEYDYLVGRLSGDGWFGASDASTEGDWQWVTGPETGTSFWSGLGDGSPVGGEFSNWADGEPNDSGGEDCAQFYSGGGGWNDLPCDGDYLQYYVVEYGGPSDLPSAPESISFTVNVEEPTATEIPISSCLDLIDVYDNGTDNRYDTLTLTTDIDCTGESLNPMFAQNDTDFGIIGFKGELDGQGYTITNATLDHISDNYIGLFAVSNDASFHDVTITGTVNGNECVGGLVGRAINSDFDSITIDMTINGYQNVGGLAGCFNGELDVASNITDNSSIGETIASDSNSGGLIGRMYLTEESSVAVTGNEMSGTVETNGSVAGGLIGYLDTEDTSSITIDDNTVQDIEALNTYGVGGLIGYAESSETAQVTITQNEVGSVAGSSTVGGYVGELYNYSSTNDKFIFSDIETDMDVSSDSSDNVGGLAGYSENAQYENVRLESTIYSSDDEAGGLIGESYDNNIIESSVSGTVEANDSFAGGLVGRNSETTITRSFSTADVTGDDRVGGLVGANGGYITDSYARGDVTGMTEVGGLAGRCGREITSSYATGLVTGDSSVGGFLGYSDGCDVVDSFWDMETTSQGTSGGDETGKTTAEMTDILTFTDTDTVGLTSSWDFDSVWQIATVSNDGYPCHQWSDECQEDEPEEEEEDEDDDDGIAPEVEQEAPNGGDANDDGQADNTQSNVSSFVNPVTQKYTVVQTDATCALANVSASDESTKAVKDSGYNYTTGLVNFTANCGTPGYTTTVKVIAFETSPNGLVLRKFNPTTNAYFTITNATLTMTTIGGKSAIVATYQITDGGTLDTDGVVNGTIVDPVGLASIVVSAPNTGFRR